VLSLTLVIATKTYWTLEMGLAKQSPVMSDELELSKSSLTTIIKVK